MYGELRDLVPKRYAAVTPSAKHDFAIRSPQIDHAQTGHVRCVLSTGSSRVPLRISLAQEPLIGGAIHSLASLPRNGYRPAKYLDLFKIYEGLVGSAQPDHSALRHALAHSPEALTRPATVQRLTALFGSVRVDLGDPEHVNTFWRLFGELLVAVDQALLARIHPRVSEFRS